VVIDDEIDIVIDASGFSYSDQWGDGYSLELADSCKRWKRNGTKIILLPQAFGPFTSKKIKKAIKTAVDNIDLIFPRDRISYGHLVGVAGEQNNIKLAPDFTNLIEGILPDNFDTKNNRFCVIPNYRMIDKTQKKQSEAYIAFMIRCVRYLLDSQASPFLLLHEGARDLILAQEISKAVDGNIPITIENHPLKIKGILGACEGVLSSRFHGLVSALSQGIPSLATSWSHKYLMLFEDYGFLEGIMDVKASEEEIQKKINLITNSDSRQKIKEIITKKSKIQKQLSMEMWEDVFANLDMLK
jgi:polysaccharide pyruvyl transferase WcaK-like protein